MRVQFYIISNFITIDIAVCVFVLCVCVCIVCREFNSGKYKKTFMGRIIL